MWPKKESLEKFNNWFYSEPLNSKMIDNIDLNQNKNLKQIVRRQLCRQKHQLSEQWALKLTSYVLNEWVRR